MNWGTDNAFNNGHRNYSSFGDAIDDVIQLLTNGRLYSGLNSTVDIYSIYEEGNRKKRSPKQKQLDSIYQGQLGGDLNNVKKARCPDER